jgi:hypothetical protein
MYESSIWNEAGNCDSIDARLSLIYILRNYSTYRVNLKSPSPPYLLSTITLLSIPSGQLLFSAEMLLSDSIAATIIRSCSF